MLYALYGTLGAFTCAFLYVFGKDIKENKDNMEPEASYLVSGSLGAIINFFDTLGIGSFAPLTASLRAFKQVKDRVLPGTLNVSCTIPVVSEAFIFITVIEMDILTLFSMVSAATIGSYLGAGIVSRFDERKIQLIMGVALLITVALMLASQLGIMPGGGTELGLSGVKLLIAVVVNFILGALMTAGIGLYAPCMALVYLLGMSAKVAFPIMMGSCAFLMPVASIKFIKEGAYSRKASLAVSIFGLVGVVIAAYLVKEMPLDILKWIVDVVIIYTAFTLLKTALKKQSSECI